MNQKPVPLMFSDFAVSDCKMFDWSSSLLVFIICSRFFVTLASPKLLAIGNEKKNAFFFCISLVIS